MGKRETLGRAIALAVAAVFSVGAGLFVSYLAFAFHQLAPRLGYIFLTTIVVLSMLTSVHRTMRR